MRWITAGASATPIFSYPYARSRETLDWMHRNSPLDAWHGVKMRFVNPSTGGSPLPTIATFIQLLPAGFRARRIAPRTQPYSA